MSIFSMVVEILGIAVIIGFTANFLRVLFSKD